jgi:hypothetical protein
MKGSTLTIKLDKKQTHTGHSLACYCYNPPSIKQGVIHSLPNTEAIKYHEKQDITEEIDNIKRDLQVGIYP